MLGSLSLLLLLHAATLSTADSNYNPYRYDLTVPQFTPDGRLLQTEYAQAAADHSTPVIAARISTNLCALACCRRSSHSQQARLIILPPTTSMSSSSDGAIVLALAGVLADSLSLLQAVQDQMLEDHRMYGGTKKQTAVNIATVLASQCQTYTFGGGIRPLGSTIWVTDYCNNSNNNSDYNVLILHQTDPSGALRDVVLHPSDKTVSVLGGGTAGSLLQRRLEKEWVASAAADGSDNHVQRRISQLLHIMIDEHQRNIDARTSSTSKGKHNNSPVSLEVVLLSPTKGALKLTNEQIQGLLQTAGASKRKE
jgi:20S proteasome alpha/beta subunit